MNVNEKEIKWSKSDSINCTNNNNLEKDENIYLDQVCLAIPLVFEIPFKLTSTVDLNLTSLLNLDKIKLIINKLNRKYSKKKEKTKENIDYLNTIGDSRVNCTKIDSNFISNTTKITNQSKRDMNILQAYKNKSYFTIEDYHKLKGLLVYDLRLTFRVPVGLAINKNINSKYTFTKDFISLLYESNFSRFLQLEVFKSVDILSETILTRE